MDKIIKEQFIPMNINEAWNFFSRPENLKKITPPYMGFDITSEIPETGMYEGMIITYKVKPFLNIPLNWMTEITHVRAPYFFVDNQKKGPFAIWHHQHHFREVQDGVVMKDIVYFAAPLGILGLSVEKLVIRKRVEGIFKYRHKVLESMFKQ